MARSLQGGELKGAAADPNRYSPTTSPNRIGSSRVFAVDWLRLYAAPSEEYAHICWRPPQSSSRLAIGLGIDAQQWAILLLTIGSVWVTEFINAAIEAAVNVSVAEIHPMAKVAKDVAAAAVLITVIVAMLHRLAHTWTASLGLAEDDCFRSQLNTTNYDSVRLRTYTYVL